MPPGANAFGSRKRLTATAYTNAAIVSFTYFIIVLENVFLSFTGVNLFTSLYFPAAKKSLKQKIRIHIVYADMFSISLEFLSFLYTGSHQLRLVSLFLKSLDDLMLMLGSKRLESNPKLHRGISVSRDKLIVLKLNYISVYLRDDS